MPRGSIQKLTIPSARIVPPRLGRTPWTGSDSEFMSLLPHRSRITRCAILGADLQRGSAVMAALCNPMLGAIDGHRLLTDAPLASRLVFAYLAAALCIT